MNELAAVFDKLIPFAIMLGVLVTAHELGHFSAAKACGVRVLKFSIGFGNPLGFGRFRLRWQRKGTQYVIAWIPLGGFVKMLGENPGEEDSPEARADRAHSLPAQPLWKKLAIVLAGPVVNLVLPVLVFVGALWVGMERPAAVIGSVERSSPAEAAGLHPGDRVVALNGERVRFWSDVEIAVRDQPGARLRFSLERRGQRLERELVTEKRPGIDVLGGAGEVGWLGVQHERQLALLGVPSNESAAARAGLQSGDKVLAVDGSPVADWSEFANAYAGKSSGEVVLRITRGDGDAAAERVVRLPALASTDALGVIAAAVRIQQVDADTPAAKAGLAAGDLLLAVDGHPIGSFQTFYETVRASGGRALRVQYARDGETRTVSVTPVLMKAQPQEGEERVYRVGIGTAPALEGGVYETERIRNPLVAIPRAVGMTVEVTGAFLHGLRQIVSGDISRKAIGGPIEIARQSKLAWDLGWAYFLQLLVLISINLGILNLLPIPVLDGGQALMFTLEAMLRERLTMRAREIAQTVGFGVLLSLMGLAFYNDITKYVIEWVRAL